MPSNDSGSFVRWQAVTREHFTVVSNLVLGLATGLLAFSVAGLNQASPSKDCLRIIEASSMLFLATSVALAVWCAINRLRDFRQTAQIARSRSIGKSVKSDMYLETKVLGQLSWRLFWWQMVLFGLGAVGVAIVVILRLWVQENAL